MRVLVFGAGAIGSLLGHRLADAGHEVTLIGRPDYVRAVQEHGLILEEARGCSLALCRSPRPGRGGRRSKPENGHKALGYDSRSNPAAATRSAPCGRSVYPTVVGRIADLPTGRRSWDLLLLTVKVYDTPEAAQALASYVQPDAPVLIVQNGVGGEELAQEALPQAEIVSGVLTLSVSVVAPGHIRLETTRGGLSLAPTRQGQEVSRWAELFASAGLRTAKYSGYRAMKWSKLLLNMQANAIPAILDTSPEAVYADPALFAAERAAFVEALAVMRALRLRVVSFPNYPVPLLVWAMKTWPPFLLRPLLTRLVASGRGDKKPSLQMDLAGGRQRSEALYLNGAVVTHAERLGLHVPVNRVLLDTLLGIATGRVPWDEFRGQPQKLEAAIHRYRIHDTGYKQRA